MLYLALLIALTALFLYWLAYRQRKAAGMPGGRVIYTDTRGWNPLEEALYSAELGLTGKPDYLVEVGKLVIPVEVKSRRVAQGPYDSHIYQLAAYCLLVEKTFGQRPPYGILHYANRTYQIDFTTELETNTLALLDEIRAQDRRRSVERSHEETERCRGCGFRASCDQRLY